MDFCKKRQYRMDNPETHSTSVIGQRSTANKTKSTTQKTEKKNNMDPNTQHEVNPYKFSFHVSVR